MEEVPGSSNRSNGGSGKKAANIHVPRIQSDTFGSHSGNYDTIIQTVSDGSALTSGALLDPSNPLTIHRPILVTDTPESIGMKVPRGAPILPKKGDQEQHADQRRKPITIREVGELVGMNEPVTVMDVTTQEELEGWCMQDLCDYFEDEERLFLDGQVERKAGAEGNANGASRANPSRRAATACRAGTASSGEGGGEFCGVSARVLNQISLEFSHTPLIRRTRSPSFVRDLDWIDNMWPAENKKLGDYPIVQYYCLTSTAGCYTDFHEE